MMAIPLVQIMLVAWGVGVACGAVGTLAALGLYYLVF